MKTPEYPLTVQGRETSMVTKRGGMDTDRVLVILLVLLLLQNDAPVELILALAYVAMG